MYRVLIVDDDSAARTQIKTLIDWEKHGFEICGEASNGQKALAVIHEEHPDIIITDISMPVMDGVMLIEHIHTLLPETRVIAVSGYDDFDYVRESMKNGAVDYILKYRLNEEILLKNLQASSKAISTQRQEKKAGLSSQLSRDTLKQDFLYQLVSGAIEDGNELELKIQAAGIQISQRNLIAVIAEIDDFSFIEERFSLSEINLLIKSFLNISKEVLYDWGKAEVWHMTKGRFLFVFSIDNLCSEMYLHSQLITVVSRIENSIKKHLNITACFSISKPCTEIIDFKKRFLEAERALKHRFYMGKGSIIKGEANEPLEDNYFSLDIEEEKAVMTALKRQDKNELALRIEKIFQRIIEKKVGYKSTQMICGELINIINRAAKEFGIDVMRVYSNNDIPYYKLYKYDTLVDIKKWVMETYHKFLELIPSALDMSQDYTEPVRKAVEYINRNFKSNISLNEASEHIGISSSYLSRAFKEEVGKGFVDYLNNIRVEAAKHLIGKEGCSFKNAVNLTGFNSYNYFFKVFKSVTGMTPMEFEKKSQN